MARSLLERSCEAARETKEPVASIRVRVENLPDDMGLDEFRNTALDLGQAASRKREVKD